MNEVPIRLLRAALDDTVRRIEPDVSNLERALDEQVERGSFAMGMMAAAFVTQNVNLVEAARLYPDVFRDFTKQCRDLNPL